MLSLNKRGWGIGILCLYLLLMLGQYVDEGSETERIVIGAILFSVGCAFGALLRYLHSRGIKRIEAGGDMLLKPIRLRKVRAAISTALICILFLINIDSAVKEINGSIGFFIYLTITLILATYFIIWLLSLLLSDFLFTLKPLNINWKKNKEVRQWVFAFVLWAIAVPIYLKFTEYYGYNASDDELLFTFSMMLIPPIFLGSARYIYVKFIQ
jgi:hypothetical protein